MDNLTSTAKEWTSADLVEHVSEVYVQPLLLGAGILTNLACVLLLWVEHLSNQHRDPEVGRCLVWLAVSDLCVTTTGFTHIVLEAWFLGGNVHFGHWSTIALINYIFYFSYLMFLGNSAFIVVVIAILRCVLIAQPLKARTWVTEDKIKVTLILGCVLTFLLFMPSSLTVVWQLCFNETNISTCVDTLEHMPHLEVGSSTYLYILGVLYIPVPVLVYIICFIIIEVSLQRSKSTLSQMERCGGLQRLRRQRLSHRVTRLLLCILVLDTLCTVPTVISSMVLIISDDLRYDKHQDPSYHIFDSVGEIMLLLRPTYNFWLYLIIYPAFRRRLGKLTTHCCGSICFTLHLAHGAERHTVLKPKPTSVHANSTFESSEVFPG